jgi:DNA (cytosine-5)-methyltransferase 1
LTLLPTPAVNDMGADKTLEWWEEWAPRQKASDGTPAPHGTTLHIEALRMLPTPTAMDSRASGGEPGSPNVTLTDATVRRADVFGKYAPAIARWEQVTGNPAPSPVEPTGKHGAMRLAPAFAEWMMGFPPGWLTAPEVGLDRREQLTGIGNAVVPLQLAAALEHMLGGAA